MVKRRCLGKELETGPSHRLQPAKLSVFLIMEQLMSNIVEMCKSEGKVLQIERDWEDGAPWAAHHQRSVVLGI